MLKLHSNRPLSDDQQELKEELDDKYGVEDKELTVVLRLMLRVNEFGKKSF